MLNRLVYLLGVALTLGGCAIAPSHPALVQGGLPALIPVRDFVADRQSTGGYAVSPDGKRLAWIGISGVRNAVWVKTIGHDDAKAFLVKARYYRWSADSQYLAMVVDPSGDEDGHIHVGQAAGPDTRLTDLTPYAETKSNIVRRVQGGSSLVITQNRRDKKVFDLLSLDLATGQHTLLATNPGTVAQWVVDRQGRLRARISLEGGQSLLQVPESASQTPIDAWRTVAQWSRFDSGHVLEISDDGSTALALSNRGRDKLALVSVDMRSGAETVRFEVPEVDLERVLLKPTTGQALMAHSAPDYPRHTIFDPALRARLSPLAQTGPHGLYVTSLDDAEQVMTVAVRSDRGTRTYLLASDGARPELLGESTLTHLADRLGPTQAVSYAARDGLTLHGYLTLPPGVAPKGLPLVLLVHGGPWARDHWDAEGSSRSLHHFFANRGYAVLQVNYRGSSGYGRAFMDKAIGEFAGKMHDDLIDGVHWAVQTGVADPAKVAIYGASYGGYSALVGATFTPEVFACAVDLVGVTDLARLLETVPSYWELGLPWWHRFVGDPAQPEQRKVMDGKSPLHRADRAQKPILIMHGVNDPRVKLEQSELMVQALRKAGKQVDYVTFQGDGHGNQKWSNNLTLYRKTEDFLASCLGGRSSGFDFYQLGSWAF
ncbi:MAG: hypothetical protein RLZZ401_1429 [Pseudomonadota bacterium]